ncbi:hypothetical protein ACFVHB_13235 [Kitasatospora sp. NPDC127111]|uniref:hypothetical protein n=1 Tax=Kitasatospora sp. NPDC127111 TaxID=3345363 RepID=UPI003645C265
MTEQVQELEPAQRPARTSPRPNLRALLAALLAGAIVLGAGLAVIGTVHKRYAATSTLSFSPRVTSVNADVVQLAASRYAVVAGSTSTVAEAAAASSLTPHELRSGLAVAVQPLTANLDITASLKDARQAATAVNAIADIVARSAASDPLIAGDVTDRADLGSVKTKPSRTLLWLITIAAAVLVAGWVGFLVRYLTLRTMARRE